MNEEVANQLVADLISDQANANLDPVDRAMLEYSAKLTLSPEKMDESDVENLRDVGFDDIAIHDICSIVAYFAFVNRIASGLGVELEPRHD